MNILVLGSGAREHSICWAVKKSKSCEKLFCSPGNAGIQKIAECEFINLKKKIQILSFCKKNSIDLVIKMMDVYENINNEEMIKIFNSHPQLAIEKRLTSFSSKEQTEAKLNECSKEEFEEFEKLNADYKKKYGFPFIIAVKGKNKDEILNNFRQRIQNNFEIEFNEAKNQVKKIASSRLEGILK